MRSDDTAPSPAPRPVGPEGGRAPDLARAERRFAEHPAVPPGGAAASRADLVRRVVRHHAPPLNRARTLILAEIEGSDRIADWVTCLVRPFTEHLDALGEGSWHARFIARAGAEPALRQAMADEALSQRPARLMLHGLNEALPPLPLGVRLERGAMVRTLLAHTCAERERLAHQRSAPPPASWRDTAAGLVDAITGLWSAPVTAAGR